jgi:hypothetical protein
MVAYPEGISFPPASSQMNDQERAFSTLPPFHSILFALLPESLLAFDEQP